MLTFKSFLSVVFLKLAKIGGFAAIFARSGSHQTKAVAIHIPTLSHLNFSRKPPLGPVLKLWAMMLSWLVPFQNLLVPGLDEVQVSHGVGDGPRTPPRCLGVPEKFK